MTSTPPDTATAPEVRDLDASAVLDPVVSARRSADAAEARLLALAVHWVDLHPVTAEHPAATFPDPPDRRAGRGAGPGVLRPGPAGRGRYAGCGRVRGGGARRGARALTLGGSGAGLRDDRALLPAPAPVGLGAVG